MTRDETIALFQKCEQARAKVLEASRSKNDADEAAKEIWNGWAEKMLAERKTLEQTGDWKASHILGGPVGLNDKTRDWIARASVDFSRCRFVPAGVDRSSIRDEYARQHSSDTCRSDPHHHDVEGPRLTGEEAKVILIEVKNYFHCSGFIFPAGARFTNTAFHCLLNLDSAQFHSFIDFNHALFYSHANFSGSLFRSLADFTGTEFYGITSFDGAQFDELVTFYNAEFYHVANFRTALLHRSSAFVSSRFHGRVDFQNGKFREDAIFRSAQFNAFASFHQASFHGPALFDECAFKTGADFRSIHSQIGFDMSGAEFGQVPDFTQATLHRDPRLDNVKIERASIIGPIWCELGDREKPWKLLGIWTIRRRIDRDAPAKFRELKRFAIQGEDHRSELQFHAHEIRTARFVDDWFWHPRFWFGVGYELFSNFGRSIIRPVIAWGVLVTVFAAIYLGISAEMNGRAPDYASLTPHGGTQSCLSVPADAPANIRTAQRQIAATTNASAEAWSLALKNGFVFIDWDRAEAARRTYGCLFGLTSDGGNTYPVVPRAVSIAGLVQNVLSAVLIFLLLLGVRNLLKLK